MTNVIEILVSEIMNTNKSETCFVAIPFEEEFWNVYKKVYEPVIIECGMIPKITYNLYGEAYLLERIFEEINNAELMIADLTKNNPNVTFEVGIAQCLLTPVLITTQTPDELPFDLHHYIAIKYSDNDNGLENLKSKLKEIIINKKQVEPDFIFSKDKRIIIEPNDLKSYNTSVIFGRILLDRAGLIDVCSLLAQRARHSYWGMGRQIAWIKDTRFRKAILEAIKHDVDVKMLICAEGNSEWYKNEWESLGVEVKYLDHGYLRLVIADKKAVVYGIPFEVKKVKTYRGYCGELIQGKNSEKIINSWVDYFSDLWQIGTNKPEELLNNIEKVINDTNIIKRLPKKIDTIKWIFFDLDKTLYINQKLLCEYEKLVIDLISSKKGLSNEAAEDIFSKCNNELWDQDNEIHPPLLQIALKSGLTPKELAKYINDRVNPKEYVKNNLALINLFKSLDEYFKFGIITNNNFNQAKKILETIGILDYFKNENIFTSDKTPYYKPNIELFKYIIKELQIKPFQCLYFADRYLTDLKPAKDIGMYICLIDNPKDLIKQLKILKKLCQTMRRN